MTGDIVDIDLIINGSVIPSKGRATVELNYETGLTVRTPEFTEEDFAAIQARKFEIKRQLDKLTIRELTEFLAAAGRNWMNPSSRWRQFATEHAQRVTGFHSSMLANDYFLLGEFIAAPASIYDQVRAELGDEHIFDEWIPVHASYIRAYGLGLAVHVLVGNLPLAGLYSLVRAISARNLSLAKLPARDPISSYAFVRSLIELDPTHPVTKSLSLAYWGRDSKVGIKAMCNADVLVVWGGQEAIREVMRSAPGVPAVLFGPKQSFSAVDLDFVEHEKAAIRLAFEFGYYDQEACFSTQHAFIRGDIAAFIPVLAREAERFCRSLPLVTGNPDILAHRSAAILEAEFKGWEVVRAGDAVVIVVPPGEVVEEHPLSRTLFIHPIADFHEVTKYIGRETQTLCVYPWSCAASFRDEWASAGAERIVELGMSRHPRQGFTHDGMRWLNQLVRVVSVERPSCQLYRYNTLNPLEFERWLFERPLAEVG